jgi:hypothetical protein
MDVFAMGARAMGIRMAIRFGIWRRTGIGTEAGIQTGIEIGIDSRKVRHVETLTVQLCKWVKGLKIRNEKQLKSV